MKKDEILNLLEDEVLIDGQNYVQTIVSQRPVNIGATSGAIMPIEDSTILRP